MMGILLLPHMPRFQPGQVVHHITYNYRGLIVDLDNTCQATDDWYQSNQTNPIVTKHGTIF